MYKEFNQVLKGYYRDTNKGCIPNVSGIYFVYTGFYDTIEKGVDLHNLIYIGESIDIKDRLDKHEKYFDWLKKCGDTEELIFSYTKVEETYRERLEAAYIYKHQPIINTECKESFNYDKTRVISSVKTKFLFEDFTLDRT